jgi:purine-nucleoside/S-methyl-5'-thioadenosine phosphorylase / adenosine deaminase
MSSMSQSPPLASSPPILKAWEIAELSHGFMGREGGVSRGVYATMNLARWIGDDPAAVEENWRRWRQLNPDFGTVARLKQVHGNVVHVVDSYDDGARVEGDGMVTSEPGIMLGIFTGDCVPILMVDAEHHIAAALHAGWRGALAGIAGEGVRAMLTMGARLDDIRAAMGPAIGGCCFEVEAELADRFAAEIPDAREHTRAGRPGKAFMSLRSIIRGQLERTGLRRDAILSVGPCTKCAAARFFSRRAAGGVTTGLQMSYIGFRS